VKTFLAIIILPLFLAACLESPGTNTGNPGTTPVGSSPGSDHNSVHLLVLSVCAKIKSCYPQSNSITCYLNSMDLQGYTSELGATAATYSKMTDLAAAVHDGTVTPNTTNFTTCTDAINTLSCADSLMQSAYSASTPTAYSATNLLFRASSACQQVY
jgi:hypothetical protein